MPTVNVDEAKTHLSSLLSQMESGEEVVIARNGKPIARLTPVESKAPRQPGRFKRESSIDPSFDDPMEHDSYFKLGLDYRGKIGNRSPRPV